MTNSQAPWYQNLLVIVYWVLLGIFAFGSWLDSISNAITLVTPPLTYIGTAMALTLLPIIHFHLKRRPLNWLAKNGQISPITGLGPKPIFMTLGMVVLLWVPRIWTIESSNLAPRVTKLEDTISRIEKDISIGVLDNSHEKTNAATELAAKIPENATAYARALKLIAEQKYPQARALLDHAETGASHETRVKLFRARAQLEYYAGEYLTAAHWYNQALIQTPEDPTLLSEASNVFFVAGDRRQAELLLERAFKIAKSKEDIDPYLDAALRSNLGVLRNEQGRFTEAYKLLTEAISRLEKIKPIPRKLIESYTALGINLWYQEKYNAAEKIFLKVTNLERQIEGKESVNSLINLGLVYSDWGDLTRAENYLNRALKRSKSRQTRHAILEDLGAIRFEAGRLEEAELMFREALKVAEAEYGPNSPDSAITLYNLGDTMGLKGNSTEATELLEQAIETGRNRLGEKHPEVGKMLYSLAREYEKLNKHGAEELYLESIAILEEKDKHASFLIMPLSRLSHLYASTGQVDKAAALTAKILTVQPKRIGPESQEIINNLAEHTRLLHRLGRHQTAAHVEERLEALRSLQTVTQPTSAHSITSQRTTPPYRI